MGSLLCYPISTNCCGQFEGTQLNSLPSHMGRSAWSSSFQGYVPLTYSGQNKEELYSVLPQLHVQPQAPDEWEDCPTVVLDETTAGSMFIEPVPVRQGQVKQGAWEMDLVVCVLFQH